MFASIPVLALSFLMPGAYNETFAPKGRAPRKGEIFQNSAHARTLRLLSEKGREAIYRGEIADRIDAYFAADGVSLRKRDFEQHTSTWVKLISTNNRGYDIYPTHAAA